MSELAPLTRRQNDVFEAIARLTETLGHSPTLSEIGGALGLRSESTVHAHLEHLEGKGYVARQGDTRSFNLQLTSSALAVARRRLPRETVALAERVARQEEGTVDALNAAIHDYPDVLRLLRGLFARHANLARARAKRAGEPTTDLLGAMAQGQISAFEAINQKLTGLTERAYTESNLAQAFQEMIDGIRLQIYEIHHQTDIEPNPERSEADTWRMRAEADEYARALALIEAFDPRVVPLKPKKPGPLHTLPVDPG